MIKLAFINNKNNRSLLILIFGSYNVHVLTTRSRGFTTFSIHRAYFKGTFRRGVKLALNPKVLNNPPLERKNPVREGQFDPENWAKLNLKKCWISLT